MLPIHLVAFSGNKQTLQYLVDSGANINKKDKVGTNESKHHWTSRMPLDVLLFINLHLTINLTFSH